MRNIYNRIIPLLITASITVFVYSIVIQNGFIENWDDNQHILSNHDIQEFSINNLRNWFSKSYVAMYQPITMASYALNFKIDAHEPIGYHLLNLCLHLLNVFLIWLLLSRLSNILWSTIIITFFFAIHPFAVEPVAWISSRSTLLALFFLLLAFNYYISGNRYLIITILLFLLAVLSRITAVLLPIYLLVYDIIYQNRPFSKKNLYQKAGMLLLALPILLLSFTFRDSTGSINYLEVIGDIPAKFLWYINHIFPFYEYSPVYDLPKLSDWRNITGLVFVSGVIWVYRKGSVETRKLIITGSMIFLISLIPHMAQFSVGAPVADRYGYVSFLGIVIVLSGLLSYLNRSRAAWIGSTSIIGLLVLFHSLKSYSYSRKWADAFTLWSHATEVMPANSYSHAKLGAWMAVHGHPEAEVELTKAITLDPGNSNALYNLGILSLNVGAHREAIKYLTRAYEIKKDLRYIIKRAQAYFATDDYSGAIEDLNLYLKEHIEAEAFLLRGQAKTKSGLDGCKDVRMALDMGLDIVLPVYVRDCILKDDD